jgi:hypothetical protein
MASVACWLLAINLPLGLRVGNVCLPAGMALILCVLGCFVQYAVVSLCAAHCVARMPLLSPRGGVCSALMLSVCCRTEPVEEDAKTNCLCHLSEPVLYAAARHVMVSCGRSCLPAVLLLALCLPTVPFACLLTAWPMTPVPCSPLAKSGVRTVTSADLGGWGCLASRSRCSLSSWLPSRGTNT